MDRNDLYEAAVRYKKTKLWEKMWDNELFAIRLPNRRIAYLSVMGRAGTHCALGVYIGKDGFRSYRRVADVADSEESDFKKFELLLQQKCLQVIFDDKESMPPEELEEARAYAKANGIRFTGQNAYPQFVKYEPNYHPWKVRTQSDIKALHEAMEAAILLNGLLEDSSLEEMGIDRIGPFSLDIPLFVLEGKELKQAGFTPVPEDEDEEYAQVPAKDEQAIATVKALPHKGIWGVALLRLPQPVQDAPEAVPYYPLLLCVVESKKAYLMPVKPVMHYEKKPEQMLDRFAEALRGHGAAPKEIRCQDERTYALLNDFCQKTGIRIKIFRGAMFALEDVEDELWERMGGFDLGGMDEEEDWDDEEDDNPLPQVVNMIMSASKDELKKMPRGMIEKVKEMIENNQLPQSVARALAAKLGL